MFIYPRNCAGNILEAIINVCKTSVEITWFEVFEAGHLQMQIFLKINEICLTIFRGHVGPTKNFHLSIF